MNYNDIMLTNMIFNSVNKISTGYFILDTVCIFAISSILFYILQPEFKNSFSKKISDIYNRWNKMNKLIFTSSDKMTSKRYRAIMFFISKKNDPTVKILTESIETKYNNRTDDYEEKKNNIYRIDQDIKFNIDTDIEGSVYNMEKEKMDYNNRAVLVEFMILEIFSKKLSLLQLESWVEERLKEFEFNLLEKACDKQLLINVSYDPKEKELNTEYNTWASNVKFENRFFQDKEKILDKINFFINNPDWYKKRGIPYTLGFLLWGEPGCGKTGFIKAMMNLTGYHGISIKLNNKFDMNKLHKIMFDDNIADLKIPQNKRILIFEDVDCMGDVVKDRDELKEFESKSKLKDNEKEKDNDKKKMSELMSELILEDSNYNNNLSYFLNILDGLQECPGRIIIMTTNKPETLDKALIRPGRIDHNIHFTKAMNKDIKNIFEFYWNDILLEDIPESVNMKYSHAEIVNICRISENIEESYKKITL